MTTAEKLEVAVEALEKIVDGDWGPAYFIARDALKNIEDDVEEKGEDDTDTGQ